VSSDLKARLQESLGGAYTLERELAGGGMSRVFVAEETALGRRVVVKVLPPDMAVGVSADRFLREVQLAARLQHPHIVPVHSAGTAGELPYYTMPFVEGETLRERLRRGPVPLDEALRILRDVARALAYAHGQGIVHRDIKPENIFLAGNAAVVSDFGIAKAISAARTRAAAAAAVDTVTQLTQAGTSVGTPAYMSPEQAAGAYDLDHRSDIYSFGCVAYELLNGTPPFVASSAHDCIRAHIAQTPVPLGQVAPSTPRGLAALVMRCLEKAPDARPQTSVELVAALESDTTPGAVHVAARGPAGTRLAMALIAIVAAGLVWAAFRALTGTPGPTNVVTGGSSLAVLPFVNVGGDTATEYFADGITDELATALGRIPGMRIAARSSAYRYRGRRDIDVREVGGDLNVDLVLTGTTRRAAARVRVSAQLTSAADGVEIWSQTFDRPFDDVVALTDSITSVISAALSQRFATAGKAAHVAPVRTQIGTANPAAYDAYLQGKFSLLRRRAGLGGAADAFGEAIELDPGFARAYAGLGTALALLTYFGDSQPPDRPARSRDAALTALRLDSANAEAHVALGILALAQHRWQDAQQALQRAVGLEPGLSDAHFHLGRALIYQGRIADGIRSIEVARGLEPFSPIYTVWLGHTLGWAGRREQALAETRRAWELDSNSILVHNLGAQAFLLLGEPAMAQRIARLQPEAAFQRGIMAWVLTQTGAVADARRLMQPVIDRRGQAWFDQVNLALFFLGVGEIDRALTALERAAERGEPVGAFNSLTSPAYDAVRADPRFVRVLTRIGLDPAILASPTGGRQP
jgi:serine/threonine-protein kinase